MARLNQAVCVSAVGAWWSTTVRKSPIPARLKNIPAP